MTVKIIENFFMKTLAYFLIFTSIFFTASCENPKEQIPETYCYCERYLNDSLESFCGEISNPNESEFESNGSFFLQYDNENWCTENSDSYQGLNIAIAINKPDIPNSYEAEANFFNYIYLLMNPETIHDLDLSVEGGFAIETWNLNGTYFSTELGPQDEKASIKVKEILVKLNGPNNPVLSRIRLILASNDVVTLWNQDNTQTISYTLNGEWFFIHY